MGSTKAYSVWSGNQCAGSTSSNSATTTRSLWMATSTVPMVTDDLPVGDVNLQKTGKLGTKAVNRGRIWRRRGACNGAEMRGPGAVA